MPAPNGPQFTRVYHRSYDEVPPHRVTRDSEIYESDEVNTHPDVIHAGTIEAANAVQDAYSRDWVHEYDIPVSHQYPVTFGDSFDMTFGPEHEHYNYHPMSTFNERMSGVQPGLFESVSGDPFTAIRSNMAVPYRNRGEDVGSISWMLPKRAINEDNIRYVGTRRAKPDDYVDEDERS